MKKLFLNVFLLPFLFTTHLAAQDTADYSKYMEEAGSRSLIFKGRLSVRYNFKHEGTEYAYSPEYEKGFVRYNDKDYYDVLLNLDSNADNLCVKKDVIMSDAVVLEKTKVESFSFGSRKFVNVKEGDAILLPGYYEVLYTDNKGISLYKKIVKFYREDISRDNSNLLLRLFEADIKYFLVKGDVSYLVKNKRSITSVFKDRKNDIQRGLSSQKITSTSLYTEKEVLFQTILKSLEK